MGIDNFEGLRVDVSYIRRDVEEIKHRLDDQFVTKQEFEPVRRVVYGMVGLILVAVVGSLIALVVRQ